jgi:hypothetical protein
LKERRPIPGELKDRLMAENRHTCCICNEPRLPVEKHHINGDPANNAWTNLAVVCRNCHGLVTATGNLGARYTAGEVLRYKQLWEKRCAEANKNEIDFPREEIHVEKVLRGGEHEPYFFDMNADDELVFAIDANDYLDIVICNEDDLDTWAEGEADNEEEEECPLPEGYWHRTDVINCKETFEAPQQGQYVLLLVNWGKDDIEVTVDAAVWEPEE